MNRIILIFLLYCGYVSAAKIEIYVAPESNCNTNSQNGSLASPFCSVTSALNRVKNYNNGVNDIYLLFRGGAYYFNSTATLSSSTIGSAGSPLTLKPYGNEKVVLSGGSQISGFSDANGDGIWEADVGTGLDFSQLLVDGVRMQRARSKAFSSSNPFNVNGQEVTLLGGSVDGVNYSTMLNWNDLAGMEFVSDDGKWRMNKGIVQGHSGNKILFSSGFTYWTMTKWKSFQSVKWVENSIELLDVPGEWYYDKSNGKLLVIPPVGISLNSVSVEIGNISTLFEIQNVSNVRLCGFSIRNADWNYSSENVGFITHQVRRVLASGAHSYLPGAIEVDHSSKILIEQLDISNITTDAIQLLEGTTSSSVVANTIHGIGGSGIILGEVSDMYHNQDTDKYNISSYIAADAQKVLNNQIVGNYINGVGEMYSGSVGIFLGLTKNSLVQNNQLFGLPYTGISVGWTWTSRVGDIYKNYSSNNAIIENFIDHPNQYFKDGGGIYILGRQGGNDWEAVDKCRNGGDCGVLVKSNFILKWNGYGGIYLDNGNRYTHVSNNVVRDGTDGHCVYIQDHPEVAGYAAIKNNYLKGGQFSGYLGTSETSNNNSALPGVESLSQTETWKFDTRANLKGTSALATSAPGAETAKKVVPVSTVMW